MHSYRTLEEFTQDNFIFTINTVNEPKSDNIFKKNIIEERFNKRFAMLFIESAFVAYLNNSRIIPGIIQL